MQVGSGREKTAMIGFTFSARGDQAQAHLSDGGARDRPPLVTKASAHNVLVVLMGRLYYRADLRARLDPASAEGLRAGEDGDAALALAAYRHDGIAGLERLEGDFALAVWDADKRHVIAMRDPMGGYPLFYRAQKGSFVVGTGMERLRDSRTSREPNPEYLADFLVAPGFMPQHADGRTVHHDILRVPPGSMIIAYPSTGGVRLHCYWEWLQRLVDPGTSDNGALAEQYRDLLRTAVRERLRGKTASHVSGGMDSTAVALVARDCLEGTEPLHTLSLIYHRLPRLARERHYLESALNAPGLMPIRVNGDDVLDFDNLETAPAHDEPSHGLVRMCAADQALAEAAAQQGVTTIMTGFGADDLFAVQPFHLADLLRGGKWLTAWREATTWGRAKNCHAWELLGPFGYLPVLPAWSRMGARNWLRGGYAPWPTNTEWTIPPWIRRDYARRMDLRGRILANIRRGRVPHQPAGLSLLLSSIDVYQDVFSRSHVAAPRGILLTHPFLDPRIFALGLGTRLRVHPQPGAQKPILAAAMRGILPDAILDRPSKGNFNEAYFTGLSRNLEWLEDLVERAPTDDLGFLDKAVLVDCLQRTALGNSGDAGVLMQLNGTLSLLLWLTLEQRKATT